MGNKPNDKNADWQQQDNKNQPNKDADWKQGKPAQGKPANQDNNKKWQNN